MIWKFSLYFAEDTKDLKNFLEKEVTFHKKTSVIKMNPSVGLMMARQAGIERSSSEFFAVLDSHIEVAEGENHNFINKAM